MTTRQFRKLAHSLYECKYHIVFCPKYRYKILQKAVATYLKEQIYRLCSQKTVSKYWKSMCKETMSSGGCHST